MKFNTKNKLFLLAAFLLLCFSGYKHFYNLGVSEGEESIARLNMVWPDFVASTPDDKRLKIAKLAMKSGLNKVDQDDYPSILLNLLKQAKTDLTNDDALLIELQEKYQEIKPFLIQDYSNQETANGTRY